MRITYLHQYFNTPSMSGGTRSYEMARRLVGIGHEVNMVTSLRDPDGRKGWFTTVEAGIKVHWLSVPYSNRMSYKQRIASFCKFAWGAARKAASLPADVVFATSTPLTIALPGVYAARRQKVPMVFEVRDLWPELPIAMGALRNPTTRKLAKCLERLAYQSSTEIIALSPGMVDGVVATGFPSAHVAEIPNSSDLDLFFPNTDWRSEFRGKHGIAEDQILVVYVGTFGRINGVGYLPQLAAALAGDTRFRFLLVGDGQEFEDVKATAQKLGVLNSNFRMFARIPKVDVPKVLAAADFATSLFIALPAMEVNSANKFFDGLAAGCCMAINYGGWQAEILDESGAGLQLDRDVTLAARQLQKLADHPERIAQAKMAARKLAEERFSRDKLAAQLEEVLARSVRSFVC
jgi:glycosyltransferase involved in cell wall biosynthesis